MNYDYDLKDIEPTDDTGKNGLYYTNYTGTSRDPYIAYSVATSDNIENTISHGMIF